MKNNKKSKKNEKEEIREVLFNYGPKRASDIFSLRLPSIVSAVANIEDYDSPNWLYVENVREIIPKVVDDYLRAGLMIMPFSHKYEYMFKKLMERRVADKDTQLTLERRRNVIDGDLTDILSGKSKLQDSVVYEKIKSLKKEKTELTTRLSEIQYRANSININDKLPLAQYLEKGEVKEIYLSSFGIHDIYYFDLKSGEVLEKEDKSITGKIINKITNLPKLIAVPLVLSSLPFLISKFMLEGLSASRINYKIEETALLNAQKQWEKLKK